MDNPENLAAFGIECYDLIANKFSKEMHDRDGGDFAATLSTIIAWFILDASDNDQNDPAIILAMINEHATRIVDVIRDGDGKEEINWDVQ
jgi:hypothetical protein